MNDFDKLAWGFAFSATGIVFGWTLNQFGQWFRGRQEDRKTLKVLLFNLLETYFIFTRSDFDKLVIKLTDKIYSKIPEEEQTETTREFIKTLYSGVVNNSLKPDLQKDLKVIQENYQKSIKDLATIDPLTAYYLSGKSNILEFFDSFQGFYDGIKQQYPNADIEKETNQAMAIIKPNFFHLTQSSLEKDIRTIAWKISPWVWYKSKRAIARIKMNAEERMDKYIDDLLEKMIPNK